MNSLDPDTLVFVGFSKEKIEGTYDVVENIQDIPTDKDSGGQMVVVQTTEGDK